MQFRIAFFSLAILVLVACGDDGGKEVDAGSVSDAGGADGGAVPDTGTTDPACADADSRGLFSSCDPCVDGDCDTIDVSGSVRYACGCTGGCPCGLACGSITIAPGISVGDVCVR
jgi:hypothetical protein